MRNDRSWLAPLTGVLFLVVAIVSFIVSGEPPDPTEDSTQEIVEFYVDDDSAQMFGAALEGFAAVLFVFFAGTLRRTLRDAEGPGGTLSAVAFAGAIIFAIGLAIDGTLTFTLAETAEDIDPVAVQAISALWHNDFLPFAVGTMTFLLATGISLVRHGALPRWLGWIAILLAITAITPIGFAAFLGAAILVAIFSVILTMRARAGGGTGYSPPPPTSEAM
jgi:hypothetical protein